MAFYETVVQTAHVSSARTLGVLGEPSLWSEKRVGAYERMSASLAMSIPSPSELTLSVSELSLSCSPVRGGEVLRHIGPRIGADTCGEFSAW